MYDQLFFTFADRTSIPVPIENLLPDRRPFWRFESSKSFVFPFRHIASTLRRAILRVSKLEATWIDLERTSASFTNQRYARVVCGYVFFLARKATVYLPFVYSAKRPCPEFFAAIQTLSYRKPIGSIVSTFLRTIFRFVCFGKRLAANNTHEPSISHIFHSLRWPLLLIGKGSKGVCLFGVVHEATPIPFDYITERKV